MKIPIRLTLIPLKSDLSRLLSNGERVSGEVLRRLNAEQRHEAAYKYHYHKQPDEQS